jgi:DNA (cytosine-5)-methyltransferase 1
MRYLSLFSGIEAASVAWEPLGWKAVAFAQHDPEHDYRHGPDFPSAVLAHHYPNVPNLGDVTRIDDLDIAALGPIDIVVGGSPCQDLSSAGNRAGLTGARSSLFHEQVRIFRAARRYCGARFLLWENVPGAFSSNAGRDFAVVVGAMAGLADGDVTVPPKGWGNEGVIAGPQGLVEWAVLDAQHFGVAQRRRRVFALLDAGDWSRRPPVLTQQSRLRGDSPTRPGPRQDVAPSLAGGTGGGGGHQYRQKGNEHAVVIAPDVARCVATREGSSQDWETTTMVAHSRRADGFDASEDETGRGTPLVPCVAGTLKANNGGGGFGSDPSETFVPVAFSAQMSVPQTDFDMRQTLQAKNPMAVAFDMAQITSATNRSRAEPSAPAGTMSKASAMHVETPMQVRRLTPRECERLQGFQDDYTLVPHRGKVAADGPRYKALGNSMAVPVMRWIGEWIDVAVVLEG